MTDAAATFSIDVEGSAPSFSKEATKSLEELRASVKGSQDSVKQYSEALRGLTGKTTEVLDAKTKLRAAIDREKTTIAQGNIEILKMGTNYGKLAAEAKKAQAANDNGTKSIKAIGGPLQAGIDKLEQLKDVMGSGSAASAVFGGALALLAVAVVAVTAAAVAGVVSLAKWIVTSADAARSLNLVREAATGSAQNAAALGTQVDALARKVPTAKKELNDMAADLYRRFNNTSASGQTIVDTFNIVAQASEAMGKTVGTQLGDIVERSKRVGMLRLNPFELQGTGIKFQDVAKNLAKDLNVSIADAQKALFQGRVKLADGAAALRKTVEERFGEVNARKMMSFDVIFQKWHESLDSLTKGVKIEPLSKALGDFMNLFDPSKTQTGANLRKLTELVGNGLVKAFVKLEPIAKAVFKGLIIGALDVGIATLKLALWWKQSFGGLKTDKLDLAKLALDGAKVAVYALAAGLALAAAGLYLVITPFVKLVELVQYLQKLTSKPVVGEGAFTMGKSLAGGGASTFSGGGEQAGPGGGTGTRVAPANAEGGLVVQAPAGEAFAAVAPGETIVPAGASMGGGAGKGGPINLTIHFHIGAGAPKGIAKELGAPNILAPLVKAIEDTLVAAGFPVQGVPQP
jgi:hypothetical protein